MTASQSTIMTRRFLFLTRTKRSDYIVRSGSGVSAVTDDEAEFYDRLRSQGIKSTEEPFALIADNDNFCYVLAGGIKTGEKDKEGRPIRFSFMIDFPLDEKDTALRCFLNLVNQWDKTAGIIRSCIDDEAYSRDEVSFSNDSFINSLSDSHNDFRINLSLKDRTAKSKSSRTKIFALIATLVIAIGFIMLNMTSRLREAEERANVLREISPDLKSAVTVLDESYTYITMIDDEGNKDNLDLIVKSSREKTQEARKLINAVSEKIAGL